MAKPGPQGVTKGLDCRQLSFHRSSVELTDALKSIRDGHGPGFGVSAGN